MSLQDRLVAVLAEADAELANEKADNVSIQARLDDSLARLSAAISQATADAATIAALRARIAALEAGTPTTPPKVRTLVGQSTARKPTQAQLDADSAVLGVPLGVGRFFFGDTALKVASFGALAGKAIAYSHKPYPASTSPTSAQRAEKIAFLKALPTDVRLYDLCFDHEDDAKVAKGVYSLADAVRAWNEHAALVKQYAPPNVKTVLLLTGFDAEARFKSFAQGGIRQDLMDVFAFDFYRGQKAAEVLAACAKWFPGKPLGVGEIGCGVINGARGTDAERAAFLRSEVVTIAKRTDVEFMCYFQYGEHHSIRSDETQSRAAWAEVRAAAA